MHKLFAYLKLVRFPAVFTAVADVLAGFACVSGGFEPLSTLAWLALTSALLYSAGMTFNDLFDRHADAVHRPERPIPSGMVTAREAAILGVCFFGLAFTIAVYVNAAAAAVTFALLMLILCYDTAAKHSPLGPLVMGACRGLNVLLGASAGGVFGLLVQPPAATMAAALTVYVAGLTWIARGETTGGSTRDLLLGHTFVNLGLLAFGWLTQTLASRFGPSALLIVLIVAVTANYRLSLIWKLRSSLTVRRAVRTLLLSIVVLDAAMTLFVTGRPAFGLCVLALLVPHLLLQKLFSVV